MLLGLSIRNDISLVDRSGRPCHFVEVPLKASRLLMSDARARGLGVAWRAGWSMTLADPDYVQNLDSITTTTLSVHANKYNPLALSVYMGYLFDAALPGDRLETQNVIVSNAQRLSAMLPIPVLLENAPIGPGDAPTWSLEPNFIWQTLVGAQCKMQLNLAHALINAEHLEMELDLYLEMLPLDAVTHIRVSGVRYSEARGALYDARETLTHRELDALRFALDNASPKAIVLDYGGDDPEQVGEQFEAIRKLLGLPTRNEQNAESP